MQNSPPVTASFATGFAAAVVHGHRAKPTMRGEEIAALLGWQVATFQKRRHQLMRAGMPRPIAGMDQVWSRANIMAWIDGSGVQTRQASAARDAIDLERETAEAAIAARQTGGRA